ncbi:MAG: HlyD family secretion protein [Alphaproteobacteria bacterium]|nr:HlyD family secretion protein [Alphaproteobacteria bacterium]MDP6812992.1 HlyD family secretion protein [Alphaproteobacteria bacterium]
MNDKSTTARLEAQEDRQTDGATLPPGRSRAKRAIGRLLLILAVLVGVAGLIYWVYGRYTNVVVYDARIKADMITVGSRIEGWVTKVAVSEGTVVEATQPLVIIDDRDSRLRLEEIDAERQSLRAERERIEAEIRMIDQQTQGRYDASEAALRAAEAANAAVDTELEQVRTDFERGQSLLNKKVISRQRWENLRTAYRLASQQSLKAQADVAQATAAVLEAKADRQRIDVLHRHIAGLGFDEERLNTQRRRQEIDLGDRTIKATGSGIVDRVFIEAGEFVSRGQRLLLIHNPKNIWIEANVKETDIRNVRVGSKARISVDAYPDLKPVGEVVRIGFAATNQFALLPSPNPSGSFTKITQRLPVKIAIPQVEGLLRPGMMVEVEIAIARD